MDRETFFYYIGWATLILIVALLIINIINDKKIPGVLEKDKDWEYSWVCSQYKFKSQEDVNNGFNCQLEQCIIKEEQPLRIEECKCVLNNLTVNRVCTHALYAKRYDYPDFSPIKKLNISQTENISITGVGGG